MDPPEIEVEVVYALPAEQAVVRLSLAAAATVEAAILQSGLLERYPEIRLVPLCVGIFGTITPLDARLRTGDRVEIYRPLTVDPKEARRRRVYLRAAKNRSA